MPNIIVLCQRLLQTRHPEVEVLWPFVFLIPDNSCWDRLTHTNVIDVDRGRDRSWELNAMKMFLDQVQRHMHASIVQPGVRCRGRGHATAGCRRPGASKRITRRPLPRHQHRLLDELHEGRKCAGSCRVCARVKVEPLS